MDDHSQSKVMGATHTHPRDGRWGAWWALRVVAGLAIVLTIGFALSDLAPAGPLAGTIRWVGGFLAPVVSQLSAAAKTLFIFVAVLHLTWVAALRLATSMTRAEVVLAVVREGAAIGVCWGVICSAESGWAHANALAYAAVSLGILMRTSARSTEA
jgi:hypothetical protein